MSKSWQQLNIPRNPQTLNPSRQTNLQRGGAVVHVNDWRALCKKYGSICLCCRKETPIDLLTRDHIIPISKLKSSNGIHNLQPLCKRCNEVKDNLTIDFRPEYSCVAPNLLTGRMKLLYETVTTNYEKKLKVAEEKAEVIQLQNALKKRNQEIITLKEDNDSKMAQLLRLQEQLHDANDENKRLAEEIIRLKNSPIS